MRFPICIVLILLSASAACHAQERGVTMSLGLKLWAAEWSSFTYATANGRQVIAQVDPVSRVLLVPTATLRWGDFQLSGSGFSQGYDGSRRREWDLNAGWTVMPGISLTAGYKSMAQLGGYSYQPKGWILGANAAAPLSGAWSLYGSLGLGRMTTQQGGNEINRIVSFSPSPYRIVEAGLAYGIPSDRYVQALSIAVGYRTQVLVSKGVKDDGNGSANDLTQGLSVSISAAF